MLERVLRNARDGFIQITYPALCALCDRPVDSYDDGAACSACWEDTNITRLLVEAPVCTKCGAPLLTSFLSNVGSNKRCGSCEGLPFWSARSCGVYGGALEANILFLKSYPHICRRFREIIGQTLSVHSQALESDVIIPAPLHNSRRRERGFNQAEVIAAAVKHFARVEVDARSLVREKRTERHRAGMDAVDRARSIDGAFKVVRPRRIGGQSVLLVDDLLTTGCTLGEAARVLLDAGAGRVNALVLARVLTGRQRGQIGC